MIVPIAVSSSKLQPITDAKPHEECLSISRHRVCINIHSEMVAVYGEGENKLNGLCCSTVVQPTVIPPDWVPKPDCAVTS